MEVKDLIVEKVQKYYEYEVVSSLMYLEEYDIEGEITTRIMSLDTDTSMKETNQIGLDMLYQADIPNYIKINKEVKKNLRKSYTVLWELYNKQLQKSINTTINYDAKIQDNPIELLNSIKILMNEPERSTYPFALIPEAFKRVVNMNQKDNQSLVDYSKCPKQGKYILE